MDMRKSIVAVFADHLAAEAVVAKRMAADFGMKPLNVVGKNCRDQMKFRGVRDSFFGGLRQHQRTEEQHRPIRSRHEGRRLSKNGAGLGTGSHTRQGHLRYNKPLPPRCPFLLEIGRLDLSSHPCAWLNGAFRTGASRLTLYRQEQPCTPKPVH